MTSPSYEYSKFDWVNNTTAITDTQLDRMEEAIRLATLLKSFSVLVVWKNADGTWPARHTARDDVLHIWLGPLPSPARVTTGTAGMRSGRDLYFESPLP